MTQFSRNYNLIDWVCKLGILLMKATIDIYRSCKSDHGLSSLNIIIFIWFGHVHHQILDQFDKMVDVWWPYS